ncbi:coiled-coil domain-containing protein [Brachionus plicatilis]|uniref:Coiled-coil domain-containing protein n=1 Tax=Brachionus plicatilis TaxID=10195 RepID=A0A3M7RFC7_BRAPC|nr:coiled-coil domain-containing protein [Brachionus plicatilis]
MEKLSISEKIEELKQKLALLDGDRKAFTENAEWTKRKNHEKIEQLRKENKELRHKLKDLIEGDEKVLNKAFSGRHSERVALKNKTGETAITIVDHKHSDHIKRLNAIKHENATKLKHLEELQTRYNQVVKDADEAVKTDAGESETAMRLRLLENRLNKAELKCNEALTIQRTYNQIKAHLLQESLTYSNRLDDLEKQIEKSNDELKKLRIINKDASFAKENASNEFTKFEDKVYKERKEREIYLESMKKEAEQKKLQAERIDRRLLQRPSTPPEDITKEMTEAEREKISSYEEAFEKIKEETGVNSMAEVVERYKGQGDKTTRLEADKADALEKIAKLKDEKENLVKKFEEMKYSGEQKMSEGQRTIEEQEDKLQKEEQRRDATRVKMEQTRRLLVQVKSDIEHLANKVHHLKATKSHVASTVISPKSDEFVLDLLSVTEEKLIKLYEDLEAQGMNETKQQMKEEGLYFANALDAKLPPHNTRIVFPNKTGDRAFDDEDGSGDEGTEDFRGYREQIKQASKQIVDSKTKRNQIKKNKK